MSSEKVQQCLQKIQREKKKQEAQFRYEVLSYFNLGEKVDRKEGDTIEDFLLEDSSGNKFKYDCDISEEDFVIVKTAYEESRARINDKAETTLNVCANVLLSIGIAVFAILSYKAFDNESGTLFGIGAGVFFTSLIEFAFAKVLVNISCKLNKLR